MISPAYVTLMARYNRWQNRLILDAAELLPLSRREGVIADQMGAALWADLSWLSRLDGCERSEFAESHASAHFADWEAGRRLRLETDARMVDWAARLTDVELSGWLFWHVPSLGKAMSREMALCVVDLLTAQLRHRSRLALILEQSGIEVEALSPSQMPADAD